MLGSAETRHTHKCHPRHRSDGQLLQNERERRGWTGTDRQRQSKHQLYTGMAILGKSLPNAVSQCSYIRVRHTQRQSKENREIKKLGRKERQREKACVRERER